MLKYSDFEKSIVTTKSFCKRCKYRGAQYSAGWEWCEKPKEDGTNFTSTIGRITAVRKIDKNKDGECQDCQEVKSWWKKWFK